MTRCVRCTRLPPYLCEGGTGQYTDQLLYNRLKCGLPVSVLLEFHCYMHAEPSECCLEPVSLAALDLEPAHDHLAELVVEEAVEEGIEGGVGQQQPQASGLSPTRQHPGLRGRVDNGHHCQGSPAHEQHALQSQHNAIKSMTGKPKLSQAQVNQDWVA